MRTISTLSATALFVISAMVLDQVLISESAAGSVAEMNAAAPDADPGVEMEKNGGGEVTKKGHAQKRKPKTGARVKKREHRRAAEAAGEYPKPRRHDARVIESDK